jgi:NADP-dependent 3-hydroxy acid dehydrogenase YdfG
MEVNVFAVARMAKLVLPYMRKQKSGGYYMVESKQLCNDVLHNLKLLGTVKKMYVGSLHDTQEVASLSRKQ